MTISLITPTADQPTGIALLERYMARQTVPYDQWIVADDGNEHATLTMGQTHLRRPRNYEGGASLAGNILTALPHVEGDIVIVAEHDDWYSDDHIETCLAHLENAKATGSQWQRYYNVSNATYTVMKNVGSSLCNTAFKRELIPKMRDAAERCKAKNAIGVDRAFWDSVKGNIHNVNTVVGIKGLPGRKGLGMGHRMTGNPDPDFKTLREWIGGDIENYYGILPGTEFPDAPEEPELRSQWPQER